MKDGALEVHIQFCMQYRVDYGFHMWNNPVSSTLVWDLREVTSDKGYRPAYISLVCTQEYIIWFFVEAGIQKRAYTLLRSS